MADYNEELMGWLYKFLRDFFSIYSKASQEHQRTKLYNKKMETIYKFETILDEYEKNRNSPDFDGKKDFPFTTRKINTDFAQKIDKALTEKGIEHLIQPRSDGTYLHHLSDEITQQQILETLSEMGAVSLIKSTDELHKTYPGEMTVIKDMSRHEFEAFKNSLEKAALEQGIRVEFAQKVSEDDPNKHNVYVPSKFYDDAITSGVIGGAAIDAKIWHGHGIISTMHNEEFVRKNQYFDEIFDNAHDNSNINIFFPQNTPAQMIAVSGDKMFVFKDGKMIDRLNLNGDKDKTYKKVYEYINKQHNPAKISIDDIKQDATGITLSFVVNDKNAPVKDTIKIADERATDNNVTLSKEEMLAKVAEDIRLGDKSYVLGGIITKGMHLCASAARVTAFQRETYALNYIQEQLAQKGATVDFTQSIFETAKMRLDGRVPEEKALLDVLNENPPKKEQLESYLKSQNAMSAGCFKPSQEKQAMLFGEKMEEAIDMICRAYCEKEFKLITNIQEAQSQGKSVNVAIREALENVQADDPTIKMMLEKYAEEAQQSYDKNGMNLLLGRDKVHSSTISKHTQFEVEDHIGDNEHENTEQYFENDLE